MGQRTAAARRMAASLRPGVNANCGGALGLWRSQKPSSPAVRQQRWPEALRCRRCEAATAGLVVRSVFMVA